jgi:uncharacterized Fe-S center protein
MTVKVYHASMRANVRRNLLDKIDLLLNKIGLPSAFEKHHLVAVKTHFGEEGNTAFVRPVYLRQVVQNVLKTGARAFVTDASTLYRGSRGDAVAHLETAFHHGFTYSTLGAPVVIADGLRSAASVPVDIDGQHYKQVPIAESIALADGLVAVSHFKLHEATGFGGALKNIGMGVAPREGKLSMHSSVSPVVDKNRCTGDALCVQACTFKAIKLVNRKAEINPALCTGCAECLGVCPVQAIGIRWNQAREVLQQRMVEFALGAVNKKDGRCFYLNFVMRVSPGCDCFGMNDAPLVPDLGVFASIDPVAVDQACVDALNAAPGLPGSALKKALAPGTDKIDDVYPGLDYNAQLEHAEKLGLGRRKHDLVSIG